MPSILVSKEYQKKSEYAFQVTNVYLSRCSTESTYIKYYLTPIAYFYNCGVTFSTVITSAPLAQENFDFAKSENFPEV